MTPTQAGLLVVLCLLHCADAFYQASRKELFVHASQDDGAAAATAAADDVDRRQRPGDCAPREVCVGGSQ